MFWNIYWKLYLDSFYIVIYIYILENHKYFRLFMLAVCEMIIQLWLRFMYLCNLS